MSEPEHKRFSSIPTGKLSLRPSFIEALRRISPKKRRTPVPYVIALGVLIVLGVLAADPMVRESVMGSNPFAHRHGCQWTPR